MSGDELRWLVGTATTVVLAIATIAIGAFRAMSGRLDRAVEKIEIAMRSEDAQLHSRINDVRERYVRRDDFERHMQRLDEALKEIRADQKTIIGMMGKHTAARPRASRET